MAMNHVDEFVAVLRTAVVEFEKDWKDNHAKNPVHYPLELDENNNGLWVEMFVDFLSRQPLQ